MEKSSVVTVHYFLRGQQKSCCYLHGMLVSDILADLAARNKLDDCGYLKEGVCRLLQKQKLEGGKNYVYEGFGMKAKSFFSTMVDGMRNTLFQRSKPKLHLLTLSASVSEKHNVDSVKLADPKKTSNYIDSCKSLTLLAECAPDALDSWAGQPFIPSPVGANACGWSSDDSKVIIPEMVTHQESLNCNDIVTYVDYECTNVCPNLNLKEEPS